MKLVERPSPNHDDRRGLPVSMLVLHYTGMETAEAALERLTDPAAKVSAHYTIDEGGVVYAHVPEDRRAWHAGISFWREITDVNAASIGIELVNPGHEFGYRPFPEAQMAALTDLAHDILARHSIPARNVVGHSDVAPLRKSDPGELFDWRRLAQVGIGLWPEACEITSADEIAPGADGEAVLRYQEQLSFFGYGIEKTGCFDEATVAVTVAFQRHFRPHCIDGRADAETQALLTGLLGASR